MKKNYKKNKRLVILPVIFVFLAIILVFVYVFALPKKALSQILNNFEKATNVSKIIKAEDGQEKFNIAAYNNNPKYISLPDDQFEGMGIIDPNRGNGMDISSYINDNNYLMINANYQNLIQIPAPGEPTIVFDKGVKVSDGDVYTRGRRDLIFQEHYMNWSRNIRGNYIYYYR